MSRVGTTCPSRARPSQPLVGWRDPWLLAALVGFAAIVLWTAAPLATGALAPASSDARIQLSVPVSTSVTPGWSTGSANVRIPNLSIPGEPRDATSAGWRMSSNWTKGYEVRIRATTDPALRGSNAVDGEGAASATFADFTTEQCPCAWTGKGFNRGVFGYSVAVTGNDGATALDTDKWGSGKSRKWRGLSRDSYRAYSTAGGPGSYSMSIMLRSMIPTGATQLEGSYRASIVVSAHPLS